MRIKDPISGHSCGKVFYVSYGGWYNDGNNELPGGAEMLAFTMDKKKYNVGGKAKVILPEITNGNVLVSIENGNKMIKQFWHNPNSDKECEFTLTEEMSPNVYVHISAIQEHAQKQNDLPIRLYGIENISVENSNTKLTPIISMPKSIEPESDFKIKVSEENKMTYTIEPESEAIFKEALGVKTWDIIYWRYERDEALNSENDIPVVKFLGPFKLNKNETIVYMPNYVGLMRQEIYLTVKKPLMTLATLPRQLAPGPNG